MIAARAALLLLAASCPFLVTGYVTPPSKTLCTHKLNSIARAASLSSDNNEESASDPIMSARAARITAPLSALFTSATIAFNGASPAFAAELDYPYAFDASIRRYFPGSLPNSEVASRISSAMRNRGYRPYNTLVGASLCSDEVNDTPQALVADIQRKLTDTKDGGIFNLGGLGGLPFVGTSGIGAFLSHCPNSGKIFIMFGPHVGISQEGVVGKVERIGVANPSTSCGAAVGAYKALKSGAEIVPAGITDVQEEYIINNLKPRLEGFKGGGDEAVAFVTKRMFDLVVEMLTAQIEAASSKAGFWSKVSEITIMGGIVINRGHGQGRKGGEDYFQPLMLKSFSSKGEDDIYKDVFADLPTPVKCYCVVQS